MRTTRTQWLFIAFLSLGMVTGAVKLLAEAVASGTLINEEALMDGDVYREMWRPFVTVEATRSNRTDILNGTFGTEDVSASGFLIKGAYERDRRCHVYAVTNYHVVEDAFEGSVMVRSSTRSVDAGTDVFVAEIVRTSPYADLALLRVTGLRCDTTLTARLAASAKDVKVFSKVWHSTAAGGLPGNHQLLEGQISRYLREDPFGDHSLSTSVQVALGESGSAVYQHSLWGGYEIIGIVRSRDGEAATNYVIPVDYLQILLHVA